MGTGMLQYIGAVRSAAPGGGACSGLRAGLRFWLEARELARSRDGEGRATSSDRRLGREAGGRLHNAGGEGAAARCVEREKDVGKTGNEPAAYY